MLVYNGSTWTYGVGGLHNTSTTANSAGRCGTLDMWIFVEHGEYALLQWKTNLHWLWLKLLSFPTLEKVWDMAFESAAHKALPYSLVVAIKFALSVGKHNSSKQYYAEIRGTVTAIIVLTESLVPSLTGNLIRSQQS